MLGKHFARAQICFLCVLVFCLFVLLLTSGSCVSAVVLDADFEVIRLHVTSQLHDIVRLGGSGQGHGH